MNNMKNTRYTKISFLVKMILSSSKFKKSIQENNNKLEKVKFSKIMKDNNNNNNNQINSLIERIFTSKSQT